MEADIHGHQRKVVRSSIRPYTYGATDGILLRRGKTLPFVVERGWNAPAGHYMEQWFIIDPSTREVLHEGPAKEVLIWGLQSVTDLRTIVKEPIALLPGTYRFVFALGGVVGGETDVEAREVQAEEVA